MNTEKEVSVWEEKVIIPTYKAGKPNGSLCLAETSEQVFDLEWVFIIRFDAIDYRGGIPGRFFLHGADL